MFKCFHSHRLSVQPYVYPDHVQLSKYCFYFDLFLLPTFFSDLVGLTYLFLILLAMLISVGQAGLRAVHDLGPEIRRAISGNLEEEDFPDRDVEEPMHRVIFPCLFVPFTLPRVRRPLLIDTLLNPHTTYANLLLEIDCLSYPSPSSPRIQFEWARPHVYPLLACCVGFGCFHSLWAAVELLLIFMLCVCAFCACVLFCPSSSSMVEAAMFLC